MKDELRIQIDAIIDGKPHRKCPHCLRVLEINDFGLRRLKAHGREGQDVIANQSWCRDCRTK